MQVGSCNFDGSSRERLHQEEANSFPISPFKSQNLGILPRILMIARKVEDSSLVPVENLVIAEDKLAIAEERRLVLDERHLVAI